MTFDKFVLNQYLRGYGVRVAESILVRRGQEQLINKKHIIETVGMPCFVKPTNDGSSFGVSKVKKPDQLAAALRVAMMESDEVMIERSWKAPKSPWAATRPRKRRWCSP